MQKFLDSLKVVNEWVNKEEFIGIQGGTGHQSIEIQIKTHCFKEFVEEQNIAPCYVERFSREGELNIELQIEIEGILFFTIMDEHEYEAEFREWHTEEPNIDEEFIVETPRGMTVEQVRMKEIGLNLYRDFL